MKTRMSIWMRMSNECMDACMDRYHIQKGVIWWS